MHLTKAKIYFDYTKKKRAKYVLHKFGSDRDFSVLYLYVSETTIFVSGIIEGESLLVKFD